MCLPLINVSSCRVTAMNNLTVMTSLKATLMVTAIMVCSSCGTDRARLSGWQTEAINHNLRGIKAEKSQDHDRALEEFRESLRINGAVDNAEGKIVALINISRVSRFKGDIESATKAVNEAIELATDKSPLAAELSFEKSSVELHRNNLSIAHEWAVRAVTAAEGSKLANKVNLLARVLYLDKKYSLAKEQAEKALSLSKNEVIPEEEANALRLLGYIHLHARHHLEAIAAFDQALALDKNIGKSTKIAADLRGLALTHNSMKNEQAALPYYNRAKAVSIHNGDVAAAADDLLQMAKIHEILGEKQKSVERLKERDILLQRTVR